MSTLQPLITDFSLVSVNCNDSTSITGVNIGWNVSGIPSYFNQQDTTIYSLCNYPYINNSILDLNTSPKMLIQAVIRERGDCYCDGQEIVISTQQSLCCCNLTNITFDGQTFSSSQDFTSDNYVSGWENGPIDGLDFGEYMWKYNSSNFEIKIDYNIYVYPEFDNTQAPFIPKQSASIFLICDPITVPQIDVEQTQETWKDNATGDPTNDIVIKKYREITTFNPINCSTTFAITDADGPDLPLSPPYQLNPIFEKIMPEPFYGPNHNFNIIKTLGYSWITKKIQKQDSFGSICEDLTIGNSSNYSLRGVVIEFMGRSFTIGDNSTYGTQSLNQEYWEDFSPSVDNPGGQINISYYKYANKIENCGDASRWVAKAVSLTIVPSILNDVASPAKNGWTISITETCNQFDEDPNNCQPPSPSLSRTRFWEGSLRCRNFQPFGNPFKRSEYSNSNIIEYLDDPMEYIDSPNNNGTCDLSSTPPSVNIILPDKHIITGYCCGSISADSSETICGTNIPHCISSLSQDCDTALNLGPILPIGGTNVSTQIIAGVPISVNPNIGYIGQYRIVPSSCGYSINNYSMPSSSIASWKRNSTIDFFVAVALPNGRTGDWIPAGAIEIDDNSNITVSMSHVIDNEILNYIEELP